MSSEDHKQEQRLGYVGRSTPRVDALDKVTGKAVYPGDRSLPGMLHLKILFAGRPHARVLRVDTRRALQLPGVVRVLTASDVPVNSYGLAFNDQPVLCDTVVRFEGDQVAVVVAETETAAAKARDLIDVSYEELPAVTDARLAMQAAAPQLHLDHPGNLLSEIHIRKGDIQQGFAQADAIVESDYFLPMQEHAFLQPEAGLAYMDGDVVVVETAGQWAHHDQRQIARSLSLPVEKVRVIYRTIGGAFGGREDISVQIILALAAKITGRPVKIVWSRDESIRGHAKRHQMYIHSRWGADRSGRLIAAECEVISDAGAYAYTSTMVLGHAALTCTNVYNIPNLRVDAAAIYTNNVPAGAFRGFGSPQGGFSAEMQMNKLAQILGIDPVTIRQINLLKPGDRLSTGAELPETVHLEPLLHTCAAKAGWKREANAWRPPSVEDNHRSPAGGGFCGGAGIALGIKNIGFSFGYPEESTARIVLSGDVDIEIAEVAFGGADCGQGLETVMQQIAADTLGIPLSRIAYIGADTGRSAEAGSASASRLTLMGGNAIRGAAQAALERWRNEDRPAVGEYTYHAPLTTDFDPLDGHGIPHVVFSPIAQAVEVQVDVDTGKVSVPRVVSVIDPGRAINPNQVSGQVDGAVVQAIGYTLVENFMSQDGRILTPNLSTYLIPTSLDIPSKVEAYLVENFEPIGPYGARGIGETPFIAVAPALAAAIHQAVGIWFDRLPIVPPVISAGLKNCSNIHANHKKGERRVRSEPEITN